MRRLNIRWRLTLWYGGVLGAVLLVFGAAVYLLMRNVLVARVDAELTAELQEVVDDIESSADWSKLGQRWSRRFARRGGYEFQVSRTHGEVLARSDGLDVEGFPVPPVPHSLRQLDFESAPLGARTVDRGAAGRYRAAAQIVPGKNGLLVAQVAATLAPVEHELSELLAVLLLAGPLALAGALGGGYLMARKALAPVDRMAAAADQITATRLDRRLEVPNPDDELGRLARTLNGMIARLERSFEEIRRFTADASHELRTPLAVLRSAAEVALRTDREPEHYRRVLEEQLEEIAHLSRLAERLLFLCREDAGLVGTNRQTLKLEEIVRDAADLMQPVAEAKGLRLTVERLESCPVSGEESHLRRLFLNLLDNAVKYTRAGGTITVRAEATDGKARVVFTDTGVGIAPEQLPRVFDRFFRVDAARELEPEGAGLGLAISRAIAEGHSGTIEIVSTHGQGTSVTVLLPLSG
jgi:heavy metal sensor kinase